MKSGFGLVLLAVCCVSFTGCANWQNRAGRVNSPGGAAGLEMAPPPPSGPLLSAPGTSINEPPPPVAPPPAGNDPFFTPGPGQITTPPGERLNLSSAPKPSGASASASSSAAPSKMYNLESSSSRSGTASAGTKSSTKKSSTISRLAEKSDASEKPAVAKTDEPAAAPRAETASARPSALERLSRASQDTPDGPTPTSLPRPAAASEAPAAPSAPAAADTSTEIDTTLLAQPVRKGADAGDAASPQKESKGPQSSLMPSRNFFTNKPVIYPVSHPAVEEPVDVTQFS